MFIALDDELVPGASERPAPLTARIEEISGRLSPAEPREPTHVLAGWMAYRALEREHKAPPPPEPWHQHPPSQPTKLQVAGMDVYQSPHMPPDAFMLVAECVW